MKDKQQIYNDYGITDQNHLQKAVSVGMQAADSTGEDLVGLAAGAGSLIGSVYDDITGKNAQMREFAQQEYLQEKQWEYDHPANQMARMKEAGINPLTAGQGIAGGNTSASAPSVSSPTPLGNPIDTAANVGRTINDIDIAQAKKPFELANIDAKTNEVLEKAGLTRWQKLSLQAVFPYLGAEKFAQIMNMMADYDNKSAEYHNIVKQHDLINHQIGKLKGEIALNKENLSIAELQHKILEQEEAIKKNDRWFSDESKRFYKDNGYFINVPSFDSALPTLYGNKKALSAVAEWLADYYESNAKATSKGQQTGTNEANIESGESAAYAVGKGVNRAESEFGPANNVWRAIDKIIERKWPKPDANSTDFENYQAGIRKELKEIEQAIYDASNAKDDEAVTKLKQIREVLRSKLKGSYERVLDKYK